MLQSILNDPKYDAYWLGYLSGHSKPMTRFLHYIGLFYGQVLGLAASLFIVWWAFFIIGPISYMITFVSHPLIEGNSNKPFAIRPLWSVVSFFRMLWLGSTGGIDKEIARLKPKA